ncbi:MAG: glycoside hydrolase family 99-like domain-containing protein [Victivallales bacterium]
MKQRIKMTTCTKRKDLDVVAIYFPSWHVNDHYQSWYGKGFTEWDLVKTAKPLYPGHHQPKIPSWGYFDESDPEWAAKEIDLAADHGVTTFMFDWYWYGGVRIMEEALEKGFLRAPNRKRLKFAIMWANHNWGRWPAVTGVPGMSQAWSKESAWLPVRHWLEDLDRVTDYCCEHYFSQPNYWRINDRPNFVLYDVNEFANQLGGSEKAAAALERMNKRAIRNGLPGLHFTANVGCCGDNIYGCGWDRVPGVKQIGFQSVFAYNIVRTPQYPTLSNDHPIVEYGEVIKSHQYCWNQLEKGGLTHHPVVTLGCDVTPRWHRDMTWPIDFRKLDHEPIIEGNTPEKFGELVRMAICQADHNGSNPKAIFINAWNEWTEGMYLLPEKRYGTGYLEELLRALRNA